MRSLDDVPSDVPPEGPEHLEALENAARNHPERALQTARLFQASGAVESTDPLVCFLYGLMRDEVLPGVIAKELSKLAPMKPGSRVILCNGFLAQYAAHVAAELRALEPRREPRAAGDHNDF